MKILLLTLTLSLSLFASSINFEKDLQSAKEKAIKTDKKIMMKVLHPLPHLLELPHPKE